MSLETYSFYDITGVIPGIPGEFHAGQRVTIDTDTMTVVSQELIIKVSEDILKSEELTTGEK